METHSGVVATEGRVPWGHVLVPMGFAAVVAVLSVVSGSLAREPTASTAVLWTSSGITIAVFIAAPVRRWPRLTAALLVGNATANLLLGSGAATAALFALANVVEASVAAHVVRGGRDDVPVLRCTNGALRMVAGVVVGVLAATCVMTLRLLLVPELPPVFFVNFALSHVTGAVLLGPLATFALLDRFTAGPRRLASDEVLGLVATLAVTVAVFGPWETPLPAILVVPPLMWAALRLRPIGALAVLVATGWSVTLLTIRGFGPTAVSTVNEATQAVATLRIMIVTMSVLVLWLVLLEDDRQRTASALRASERLFRSTFDDSLLGLALVSSRDLTVIEANDAASRLLRADGGPVVGTSWLAHLDSGAARQLQVTAERLEAGGDDEARMELWHERGGDRRLLDVALRPLGATEGDEARLNVQLVDITARHHTTTQLQAIAHRDELTGLANRRRVLTVLDEWLAADVAVAVIYGDLDGFKPVNDEHGHGVGDLVLRIVAGRLAGTVRSGDVVGRLGGDEFVMLLRGRDHQEVAQAVAGLGDRIRHSFEEALEVDGLSLDVGISLGAAVSRPSDDAQSLLGRADDQMYDAKAASRVGHGGRRPAMA